MKNFFQVFGRLVPVVLSFLLLGAHFSRADLNWLVPVPVLLVIFLFIRTPWSVRIVQVSLVLGALEWLRSMFSYIQIRQETGEDWARLAVILTTVSLLTVLSGLVFFSKRLKEHYGLK